MTGDLLINGVDAYTEYGISLSDGAISTLLTPPPLKDFIENEAREENGKTVILNTPVFNSRDIALNIHLTASSDEDFFTKYSAFCEVLKTGSLNIQIKQQEDVIYRCIYQSCSQFSQLLFGIAKFTLKLTEPNPANRSATSTTSLEIDEE